MSGSRPETIPPWLAYLLEPLFTAIDDVQEQARTLRGELLRLEPETLRKFKEGVSTGENQAELAVKKRTGETWIEVSRPSAAESAPKTDASSHAEHPEDAAWLASEQRRIAGLEVRELAEITATLEARLGPETADAIIGGATLAELGITADADLERLVERLRGYAGEEDDG